MATPLSIQAYRMASSPSDVQGSRNVIQWLERLQQSANTQPGAGSGPKVARELERQSNRRAGGGDGGADESESEVEGEDIGAGGAGGVDVLALADRVAEGDTEFLGLGRGVEGSETPVVKTEVVSETLKQNDSLLDDSVPIGLLANLSISNRRAGRSGHHHHHQQDRSRTGSAHSPGGSAKGSAKDLESDGDDDNNVGVANETYFMPGPATNLQERKMLIERHSPPEILVHGLVNAEDVEKLFEMWVLLISISLFLFYFSY